MSMRSRLTWLISLGFLTAASAAPAPDAGNVPPPTAAPTGPAGNPPAADPQDLTTLEANGFKVSLDIHGFRPEYGYERISRTYFRMAVFSTADERQREFGGGLIFTILVDDVPKGVKDLKDLFRHFMMANKVAARLRDGSLHALTCPPSVQGVLVRFPQRLPTPADFPKDSPAEYTQWHWYFESIQNGKWLEIHFTRGAAVGAPVPDGIEPAINRILASLQFPEASPEE